MPGPKFVGGKPPPRPDPRARRVWVTAALLRIFFWHPVLNLSLTVFRGALASVDNGGFPSVPPPRGHCLGSAGFNGSGSDAGVERGRDLAPGVFLLNYQSGCCLVLLLRKKKKSPKNPYSNLILTAVCL